MRGALAKGGADLSPWFRTDVVYKAGKRVAGGAVSRSSVGSAGPPTDLLSKHLWDESFPDMGTPGVADAKAVCGAKADGYTDDTASLQACLSAHRSVRLRSPSLPSDMQFVPSAASEVHEWGHQQCDELCAASKTCLYYMTYGGLNALISCPTLT